MVQSVPGHVSAATEAAATFGMWPTPEKHADENVTELPTEGAVDDEVDRRVQRDENVAVVGKMATVVFEESEFLTECRL